MTQEYRHEVSQNDYKKLEQRNSLKIKPIAVYNVLFVYIS